MDFIFLIVGRSGSGKTTIVNELHKRYNFNVINSYTTRKPRTENEEGHIFVSKEEYDQLENKVAFTHFAGNDYCATAEQVEENDLYIIDPRGIEYFKNTYRGNKEVKVINIDVSPCICEIRMQKRGGEQQEIWKRLRNDDSEFRGVEYISDISIENYDFDECIENIYEYIISQYQNSEMDKPLIYISHPFQAKPENLNKVSNIMETLYKTYPDYLFLSPIHALGSLYHVFDYETGIRMCTDFLDKCSEMWVYGDYANSTGCQKEIRYCQTHGIPVKYN